MKKKLEICLRNKVVYKGEVNQYNQPNGEGEAIFINKYRYIGQFRKGNPDGEGKMFYENGQLQYEGGWKAGERHGEGKAYNKNGILIYKGVSKNGKPHGEGKIFYDNGQLKYEGEFQNGKINGKGKMILTNGDIYQGEWKEGERYGYGIHHKKGKEIYEGKWRSNKHHGKGVVFARTLFTTGNWSNGVPGKNLSDIIQVNKYNDAYNCTLYGDCYPVNENFSNNFKKVLTFLSEVFKNEAVILKSFFIFKDNVLEDFLMFFAEEVKKMQQNKSDAMVNNETVIRHFFLNYLVFNNNFSKLIEKEKTEAKIESNVDKAKLSSINERIEKFKKLSAQFKVLFEKTLSGMSVIKKINILLALKDEYKDEEIVKKFLETQIMQLKNEQQKKQEKQEKTREKKLEIDFGGVSVIEARDDASRISNISLFEKEKDASFFAEEKSLQEVQISRIEQLKNELKNETLSQDEREKIERDLTILNQEYESFLDDSLQGDTSIIAGLNTSQTSFVEEKKDSIQAYIINGLEISEQDFELKNIKTITNKQGEWGGIEMISNIKLSNGVTPVIMKPKQKGKNARLVCFVREDKLYITGQIEVNHEQYKAMINDKKFWSREFGKLESLNNFNKYENINMAEKKFILEEYQEPQKKIEPKVKNFKKEKRKQ